MLSIIGRGIRRRARWSALAAAVAAWVATTSPDGGVAPAIADPILSLPDAGKGTVREHEDGQPGLAVIGDVSILAVLGAERLTAFPEAGKLAGGEPELSSGRAGVLGATRGRRWQGLLRVDFSEALRVDIDDLAGAPIATIDRFVDDAVIVWTPRVWASAWVGRHKVPFSRFRQLDRGALTAGGVPFATDRVAPDRRWGATFTGDLGALSYAAGGYADLDVIEPRTFGEADEGRDPMDPTNLPDPTLDPAFDPARDGRALAAAYVLWTPRAPIGPDHLATPRSDPWHDTARVAAGAGLMYRYRDPARGPRIDASLAGQLMWTRWAAIAELYAAIDGDASEGIELGGAAEVSALLGERVAVFARGGYDHSPRLWSAGGGASWFVTGDRRNEVTIYGWLRRDTGDGLRRDGVIVQLQASL